MSFLSNIVLAAAVAAVGATAESEPFAFARHEFQVCQGEKTLFVNFTNSGSIYFELSDSVMAAATPMMAAPTPMPTLTPPELEGGGGELSTTTMPPTVSEGPTDPQSPSRALEHQDLGSGGSPPEDTAANRRWYEAWSRENGKQPNGMGMQPAGQMLNPQMPRPQQQMPNQQAPNQQQMQMPMAQQQMPMQQQAGMGMMNGMNPMALMQQMMMMQQMQGGMGTGGGGSFRGSSTGSMSGFAPENPEFYGGGGSTPKRDRGSDSVTTTAFGTKRVDVKPVVNVIGNDRVGDVNLNVTINMGEGEKSSSDDKFARMDSEVQIDEPEEPGFLGGLFGGLFGGSGDGGDAGDGDFFFGASTTPQPTVVHQDSCWSQIKTATPTYIIASSHCTKVLSTPTCHIRTGVIERDPTTHKLTIYSGSSPGADDRQASQSSCRNEVDGQPLAACESPVSHSCHARGNVFNRLVLGDVECAPGGGRCVNDRSLMGYHCECPLEDAADIKHECQRDQASR